MLSHPTGSKGCTLTRKSVVTIASWCCALIACADGLKSCTESGSYCSIGQVRPWSGDIRTGAGIRAALDARSFRKEVIVSCTRSALMPLALHLDEEVLNIGFAHLLFVTASSSDCDAIMSHLPHTGCAWDSSPIHPAGFDRASLLWNYRWKLAARASRIGYNVMVVDMDVLFFSDPYLHLKQPPLANVTMFGNAEPFCGLNGGFIYIQNAAADGPVTWLFKEVIERPQRLLDDNLDTLRSWSRSSDIHRTRHPVLCLTFDQHWLNDCLHSTFGAAPSYDALIAQCHPASVSPAPPAPGARCEAFVHSVTTGADNRQLPELHDRNAWQYNKMHVPLMTEAEWHMKHLNRSLVPPIRGQWSEAIWAQLRDDCPNCPRWRDQDVPQAGGGMTRRGRDVEETFAYVPKWLFSNFDQTGGDGFWSPSPTGEAPKQVMGHIHCIPGAPGNLASKYGLAKLYHPPADFTAFARAHPSGSLYLTDTSAERVLALSPAVDLAAIVTDMADLHRALAGLIQLATLADRVVAWPVLACNGTWMRESRSDRGSRDSRKARKEAAARGETPRDHTPFKSVPLDLVWGLLPFVDPAFAPAYACFTTTMLGHDCSQQNGMLPPEWRHWRDARDPKVVTPSSENTILVPGAELVGLLSRWPTTNGSSRLPALSQQDATRALAGRHDAAVVYVGHPFLVQGLEHMDGCKAHGKGDCDSDVHKAFQRRADGCQGLHREWWMHEPLMPFVLPTSPHVILDADMSLTLAAHSPT